MSYRKLLLESFDHVIQSAHPDHCISKHIPKPPKGRLIVIGAGKASAAMAAAFEDAYSGPMEGLVITRYGHAVPTRHIRIIEAAHPVPDETGQKAVGELIDLLQGAGSDDLIICLISGGGSSLLSRPVDGLSFTALQDIQRQLLGSGAAIDDVNIVRKHINIALGGGLAQAAPKTKMITLTISDVVGDDPSVIASGPTVPDPSTLNDARAILTRHNIDVPDILNNQAYETPKADDPVFKHDEYHIIAKPLQSLKAAQKFWTDQGFDAEIWDAEVTGDSQAASKQHVQHVLKTIDHIKRPTAIISGGETTMTLKPNKGKGGPNTHFMLQAALLLNKQKQVYAMACDTDGIDGDGDHGGAIITPDTLSRSQELKLNPQDFLENQNSYVFFDSLGDLVKTGPSYTNVNDYRVFLVLP